MFHRAAPGAPVRPRKIISHTVKYFGRVADQHDQSATKMAALWSPVGCNAIVGRKKVPF